MPAQKLIAPPLWLWLLVVWHSGSYLGYALFRLVLPLYLVAVLGVGGLCCWLMTGAIATEQLMTRLLVFVLSGGMGRSLVLLSLCVLVAASLLPTQLAILIGMIILLWAAVFAMVMVFALAKAAIHLLTTTSPGKTGVILAGVAIASLLWLPLIRLAWEWSDRRPLDVIIF